MNKINVIFFVVLSLVLTACEKTGDKTPPVVTGIHTQVTNYDASYWTKVDGISAESSLFVTLEYQIEDPDGLPDIHQVAAIDKENDLSYGLLFRFSGDQIDNAGEDNANVFNHSFDQPLSANKVNLSNWALTAKDMQNYSHTKNFEFLLFDGVAAMNEVFIYSSAYQAGEGEDLAEDGVPAMEAMKIANHALSMVSDADAETITISFNTQDTRAKNYSLWFYDRGDRVKPVTKMKYDAEAISDNLIVVDGVTTVVIPWDHFRNLGDASNVTVVVDGEDMIGVHIVLHDDPISSELINGKNWFSYQGVSEYVRLAIINDA